MESYTTISVQPETKRKIKKLKGDQTYTEYINKVIEKRWDESDLELEDESEE